LLDLLFFTAPQDKSHLLIAIHPLSFPFFFTFHFHPDCLGLHAPNKKIQKGKRERRASGKSAASFFFNFPIFYFFPLLQQFPIRTCTNLNQNRDLVILIPE
jgi:hypothetical protein